jgi:hypothetical protein
MAVNASPLPTLEADVLGVPNTSTELLLWRPLIGRRRHRVLGTRQVEVAGT